MYLPASDFTALGIVSVPPDTVCPGFIGTLSSLDQEMLAGGLPDA